VECDLPVGVFEVTMPIENVFATETNCGGLVAVTFTHLWL